MSGPVTTSERPVPVVSAANAPFFASAAEGRLSLQRCGACGAWIFYPRYVCPECMSTDLRWEAASGRGRIESFTMVHRPQHQYFFPDAPIALIAVRLEEGPILFSRLVKSGSVPPKIGEDVEATFDVFQPGYALVHFRRPGSDLQEEETQLKSGRTPP